MKKWSWKGGRKGNEEVEKDRERYRRKGGGRRGKEED